VTQEKVSELASSEVEEQKVEEEVKVACTNDKIASQDSKVAAQEEPSNPPKNEKNCSED